MTLRTAVLVKQIPRFEEMSLGPDGRLRREGLELEMNPYCRRAVTKGVELARSQGGTCTVVTLGPPSAAEVLREAIARGADEGILVSDRAFAGSDTLATSRALAAVLESEGPFDLVLLGRNSVDADTGQVGPQVAELSGLPFLTAVRSLELEGGSLRARCEQDDGWAEAVVALPAVVSCAERLCEPAKAGPEERAGVAPGRVRTIAASALGPGPWGEQGSPTRVGEVRVLGTRRSRRVLEGTVESQVEQAIGLLSDSGALDLQGSPGPTTASEEDGEVPDGWARSGPGVGVLLEPGRPRVARELLGAGARLAWETGGSVAAIGEPEALEGLPVGSWGADSVIAVLSAEAEEDLARALGDWCESTRPWALIAPGTVYGREVASRVSARAGAGLTGDAVELTVQQGRLVAWKPAFGGQLVAAITAASPLQMATVRPGMLPLLVPRDAREVPRSELRAFPARRVVKLGSGREDDIEAIITADTVVGVGTGVDPAEYESLKPLLAALGAELAATRKVTDRGWQPRARQVGITGKSISPRLYVAIGMSGRFNHMIGVRGAGKILAVNSDPGSLVFECCDIGIVADWHEAVPLLAEGLGAARMAGA
jgi:electron transfer flavoprotein alpha subunit